jgi:hypothetical protein
MASSEKCSSCGTELRTCSACGALNPASNQRCFVCGETLAGASLRDTTGAATQIPPSGTTAPENQDASVASGAAPAFTERKGSIAGVARGCQLRQETGDRSTTWQVLTFRLDRFDAAGRPLTSVPVQMRGRRLKGYVNDGEWIEIQGTWKDGALLEPRRVRNLTTTSWVEVSGRSHTFVQLLFFFAFVGVILFLFWRFDGWSQRDFDNFLGLH